MADITISKDDTIELDTLIEESDIPLDPVSYNDTGTVLSDKFNTTGIQTGTAIIDPKEVGTHDININGQILTIKVEKQDNIPDSVVYDFEGGDTSRWDVVNDLTAVTDNVYAGSYSGYCGTAQSGTYQARVIPDGYGGGVQPSKFEYYWYETELDSFGGGIRLFNSNGNVELGLASDNPSWVIEDANGFQEITGNSDYQTWQYFSVNFDWSANTFDVYFENTSSGASYSSNGRPLITSSDIEKVQIDDFNWHSSPVWQGGGAIDMWFDNITLNA